jgi:RNA polymerase sigma factor (sigma-70 family)
MERPGWPNRVRAFSPQAITITRAGTGGAVDRANRQRLFDEVFLPHLAQAFRLARWLAGNGTDAEDIVQEASLRAFRGIHNFGGVNARAWALTITRNTAYSWLMKNRPAELVFAEDLSDFEHAQFEETRSEDVGAANPEMQLLTSASSEAVRAAIATLPASFREVIVLRELQELNYREIGEIMAIPIGTVMSRLARGRALLLRALENLR